MTQFKKNWLAEACGLDEKNFYKWANATKPFNDNREVVDPALEKAYVKAIKGKLKHPKAEEAKRRKLGYKIKEKNPAYGNLTIVESATFGFGIPLKGKDIPIVFGSRDFGTPGSVIEINGIFYLLVGNVEAPLLGEFDGYVNVKDDSLAPKIQETSQVFISRMEKPYLFNADRYYYIINRDRKCLLRKLKPSGEAGSYILLTGNAGSKKQMSVVIRQEEIEAVFLVHGHYNRL